MKPVQRRVSLNPHSRGIRDTRVRIHRETVIKGIEPVSRCIGRVVRAGRERVLIDV